MKFQEAVATSILHIPDNGEKTLNKEQQTFNRLTKKVKKLQQSLFDTEKTLNESLSFYGSDIYPAEQELLKTRKQLLLPLYSYYEGNEKLSFNDRKILKEIIRVQLDEIISLDKEPDEKIKTIFKNLYGISFEDAANEEFDEMKNEMEDLFSEAGLDIDFDDMNFKDSPEEIMRKMMEKNKQMKEQMGKQEESKTQRKKTKRQLEKEKKEQEKEEARKRSISVIYKQLAKLFHPDLEQDENAKIEKEALMKELTAAYEANDLHKLLELEMQWIHKESSHLETMSDNKLKIYNETLKEQIQDMEVQLSRFSQHPRYQPLERFSRGLFLQLKVNKQMLQLEIKRLDSIKTSMEKSILALSGSNYMSELTEIIYTFKTKPKFDLNSFNKTFSDSFFVKPKL